MAEWYSVATPAQIERLELAWPDAPTEIPELCAFILGTAREQVCAYSPTPMSIYLWSTDPVPPENGVPDRLVLAQLQQAKNLWNAGRAQADGNVGGEGYTFIPRPLDKTIQQIIRPRRGVPNVF